MVEKSFDHLLGGRSQLVLLGTPRPLAMADDDFYQAACSLQVDAEVVQYMAGHVLPVAKQPQQNVLRADVGGLRLSASLCARLSTCLARRVNLSSRSIRPLFR